MSSKRCLRVRSAGLIPALTALLPLVFFVSCSKKITSADLEEREGVLYLKDKNVPYSGECADSYEDGKKKSHVVISEGKKEGLFQSWHENGRKDEEGSYRNGAREGVFVAWYEDGVKNSEVNFVSGKKEGPQTVWHPNGQIQSRMSYVEGKENDLFESWFQDGKPEESTHWKDGEKHGESFRWNAAGQIILEEHYESGKLTTQLRWDDEGRLLIPAGKYSGKTSCRGMQIEISFEYKEETDSIVNFSHKHSCQRGSGSIEVKVLSAAKVKSDGSFLITVDKGRIFSNGLAQGEVPGSGISIVCADGKSYATCTHWTARRIDP